MNKSGVFSSGRGWAVRVKLFTFVGSIFFVALASAQVQPGRVAADSKDGTLAKLVCDYLDAQTTDQAEAILKEIESLKPTVDALEKICAEPWKFGKQEAGTRFGLKVKVGDQENDYVLTVPDGYSPEKPAPLFVGLHGATKNGESQNERWAPAVSKRNYLFLAPTATKSWMSDEGEALVFATIREVKKSFNVDPNRVFVTGFSMGGSGIWYIVPNHADQFAGIVPMAGAIPGIRFLLLPNLTNTPAYIVHGSKDATVRVQNGRIARDALRSFGQSPVYKEHDQAKPFIEGHIHPEWEVPNILDFLDGQKRNPYPDNVTLVAENNPAWLNWVRIDERNDDGFARVEATANGDLVTLKTENVKRLTLFFKNSKGPVKVFVNGKKAFDGKPAESAKALLESARHDYGGGMLFRSMVSLDVK